MTPVLADVMARSLPCREMCEALVSTCSCSKERKFGDILQTVLDSKSRVSTRCGAAYSFVIHSTAALESTVCW